MGHYTCNVLAAKIESVHDSFRLSVKINSTVTDNGSNFVKAFTTFSLPVLDVPESSGTETMLSLKKKLLL